MCDWVPGQLILSIDPKDRAALRLIDGIREGELEHVSYLESLDQRIADVGAKLLHGFESRYHLVAVPPDQEMWKASYVQAHYVRYMVAMGAVPTSLPFNAQPNLQLSPAGRLLDDIDFPDLHDDYCEMIGFDGAAALPDTSTIGVKILDSGVDDQAGLNLGTVKDFIDPKNPDTADDTGHGSVVAKIISDLAPDATLHVFKVTAADLGNEWNVAAAIGADVGAPVHIINISLQYGFEDKECDTCGRAAGTSRSWVFQTILDALADASPEPYVLASAGNSGVDKLAYPARFGTVIATGAVNSNKDLAGFSNWGEKDHADDLHEQYFVLPGGESGYVEYVAEHTPSGDRFAGTSFATAYGSAVVANVLAEQQADRGLLTHAETLDSLRAMADTSLGDSDKYGQGLMRFDP